MGIQHQYMRRLRTFNIRRLNPGCAGSMLTANAGLGNLKS